MLGNTCRHNRTTMKKNDIITLTPNSSLSLPNVKPKYQNYYNKHFEGIGEHLKYFI